MIRMIMRIRKSIRYCATAGTLFMLLMKLRVVTDMPWWSLIFGTIVGAFLGWACDEDEKEQGDIKSDLGFLDEIEDRRIVR